MSVGKYSSIHSFMFSYFRINTILSEIVFLVDYFHRILGGYLCLGLELLWQIEFVKWKRNIQYLKSGPYIIILLQTTDLFVKIYFSTHKEH